MGNLKNSFKWIMIVLFFTGGCYNSSPKSDVLVNPNVIHPEWSYNSTIYEVNIRQFSEEGTFKALERELPRLKNLGVEILWLMPIHPIGEINRKGTLGSYYSVKDYFDVNPEYGTKEDFIDLISEAHKHDLKIIIDWVANHTAWDNPIATTNPDYFEMNEDGNFIPPRGTDWDDVIQLNYENREVWDYMKSALRYWVEEFDIDGYRCDVAYLVPTEFWNEARKDLDSVKPVFMLAESETPEHHNKAFDMTYGWRMHHLFNEIAKGNESSDKIDEYLMDDYKKFPTGAFRMNFTSNHDENSWNGTEFERMGDAAKTFAVLSHTMDGMPLIYNGQEMGMNKRLEFFERDPIPWQMNEYFEFYQKLNQLKSTNNALLNGDKGAKMQRISSESNALYAFVRDSGTNKVVVFLNLSDGEIELTINSELLNGDYTNLFDEKNVTFGSEVPINLSSWEYQVFYN